jgi:hypothetical protein
MAIWIEGDLRALMLLSKHDPYDQIFESRAGGMAWVVECLPSKCEAMSLNPIPQKTKVYIYTHTDFVSLFEILVITVWKCKWIYHLETLEWKLAICLKCWASSQTVGSLL